MASIRWRRVVTAAWAIARRPAVCLVLLGIAIQLSLPGLALAALAADGPFADIMCRVQQATGETSSSTGSGETSNGAGCCLICQAMQLADGALPAPTLQPPTVSWVATPMPIALSVVTDGRSPLNQRARGPPA